ncbi:MAG: M15 family peptidase [Frankiales bacterium]|nr:M15 family peptidase [Frankiales bacterium]
MRAPVLRGAAVAAAVAVVLTGCSGGSGGPTAAGSGSTPVPVTSPATTSVAAHSSASGVIAPSVPPGATPTSRPGAVPRADAVVRPVGAAQWARIVAAGMARPGCPVTRAQLRRVEVGFWGFDGRPHRGVLVVNADVASSVAAVFTELFDARFPIRRMRPVEYYHGDDNASMRDDNTSAYNCRSAGQANAPSTASPHANGRAVDVNPLENPWRDPRCGCWMPSAAHAARRPGPGMILRGGVVWRAFTREGWIWQDISSTVDYQHFDTGYPSRPFHRRTAG